MSPRRRPQPRSLAPSPSQFSAWIFVRASALQPILTNPTTDSAALASKHEPRSINSTCQVNRGYKASHPRHTVSRVSPVQRWYAGPDMDEARYTKGCMKSHGSNTLKIVYAATHTYEIWDLLLVRPMLASQARESAESWLSCATSCKSPCLAPRLVGMIRRTRL